MGKFSGSVYKLRQPNCSYSSLDSTFVGPPRLLFTSQHDSTNDCGVTIVSHEQILRVSNLTTTSQVDADSNNYDNTQPSVTPIKHSHSAPEIPETNSATTPAHDVVYSRLFQIIASTSTTLLKLYPCVK